MHGNIKIYLCIILAEYQYFCKTKPLHFSWLLVLSLYKEDYLQFFKYVSFELQGFRS